MEPLTAVLLGVLIGIGIRDVWPTHKE